MNELQLRFRDRLSGSALYLLAQMVHKTGRFQMSGLHHLEAVRASGRPVILCAWHGMTMMLAGFLLSHGDLRSVDILLPDDWRGAALAVLSEKLGAQPFPVNLEGERPMASARRLATLMRRIQGGRNCYITPDGPDGPAYVIKPGLAFLAQKAGALILPLGAYARHAYRLNRWDQYAIPLPFSRVSIHIGAPVAVEKGQELAAAADSLTDTLHRSTAQAAANYYNRRG